MTRPRRTASDNSARRRPATTPEARELQMVALAVDLAEEQLRNGTASAQIVTHYLKLATAEEKLKREKLEEENKLLRAKTQQLGAGDRLEKLTADALAAMRSYTGVEEEIDDDYENGY